MKMIEVMGQARGKWSSVLVVVGALLAPTLLDAGLTLSSPLLAQAVNAAVPFFFFLSVWALLGRAWVALILEVGVLCLIGQVSILKYNYLGANVVYSDLSMVGSIIESPQLMFAYVSKAAIAAAVLAVLAIVFSLWFIRNLPKSSKALRAFAAIAGLSGFAVAATYRAPDAIPLLGWEVFGQMEGGKKVGTMGNLLLGHMTVRSVKQEFDLVASSKFQENDLVRRIGTQFSGLASELRPDIVVIQSESLFDPALLKGFSKTEYLKDILDAPPGQIGKLRVPVFGGRTLQTEFETISGQSIAHYPGSMYIYYEIVDVPMKALPNYLGNIGYRTVAMHPSQRGFWRRGVAMPLLGFDVFIDESAFSRPNDYSSRSHVSDAALAKAILSELDAAVVPTMIMGITMDNHGPWGRYAEEIITVPDTLTDGAKVEISDYVSRAKDANHAFRYLMQALKRRGRPTLVVLYGDHLPSLPSTYREMKFVDGKPPEQQMPPVRVWANYEIPPLPDKLPAFLLPGWILRAAQLPLSGHFLANAALGQILADSAITALDKETLTRQYGHVAAQYLVSGAVQGNEKPFAVTGAGLSKVMESKLPGRQRKVEESMFGAEFTLGLGWGSPPLVIPTDGMASVTFRAYFDNADMDCQRDARSGNYELEVQADGVPLYRAIVAPDAMRMATLDTRGVKLLKFVTRAPASGAACRNLVLRVPQIQCATLACDGGSPGPAPQANRFASRSLRHDYYMEDRLDSAVAWGSPANNLRGMVGRMLDEQTGISEFELRDNVRLFMHPVAGRDTWAEFDVDGLERVDLRPAIDPLVGECLNHNEPGKESGVVGFSVLLDGKPVRERMIVDRNYKDLLPIYIGNAKRLKLVIDQGNQVDWCDWFSVGFPEVRKRH